VATFSFPQSSHPHPYTPGRLMAEARLSPSVLAELARLGHRVQRWPAWEPRAGSLGTVVVDAATGFRFGAADPRRMAYAAGW
jgi:gamma-glutamyltranspeptidase/glutathione hydrolase